MSAEKPKSPSHFPLFEDYVGDSFNQDSQPVEVSSGIPGEARGLGSVAVGGYFRGDDVTHRFPQYPGVRPKVDNRPNPERGKVRFGNILVNREPLELPEQGRLEALADVHLDRALSRAGELFGHINIKTPAYEELAESLDMNGLRNYYINEMDAGNNPLVFLYSPDLIPSDYRRIVDGLSHRWPDIPRKITHVRYGQKVTLRRSHLGKITGLRGISQDYMTGHGGNSGWDYATQRDGMRWGVGVLNQEFEKRSDEVRMHERPGVAQYLAAQLNLLNDQQTLLDKTGCTALNYNSQLLPWRYDNLLGRWDTKGDKIQLFKGFLGQGGTQVFIGKSVESESYKRIDQLGGARYRKFKSADKLSFLGA